MSNNRNYNRGGGQNRREDSADNKTTIKIVAVLVAVVLAVYVIISLVFGMWNPLKWNEARLAQQTGSAQEGGNNEQNGGSNGGGDTAATDDELITPTEDYGISLASLEIPVENYADYGISMQADTAYTITATVNDDAVDKSVIGAISWANASSEWASGKDLSEYATLTQTEKYGLNFTLTVKQSFGEPITVKVSSCADSSVYGTSRVDYLKEIRSFTAVLNSSLSPTAAGRIYLGDTINTVTITPSYGVGTIEGTISSCTTTFILNDYTKTGLKAALAAGDGTGGFLPVDKIICDGLSFKIPFVGGGSAATGATGLTVGGGNSTAVAIIANNFIKNHGCQDYTGTSAATAGVTSVTFNIKYSYGDYSKTLSYTDGSMGFRNDNLTLISTINDIKLSETDIVVYPK